MLDKAKYDKLLKSAAKLAEEHAEAKRTLAVFKGSLQQCGQRMTCERMGLPADTTAEELEHAVEAAWAFSTSINDKIDSEFPVEQRIAQW